MENDAGKDDNDDLSEEEWRKRLQPKCTPAQILEILRSENGDADCVVISELDSYDDNNWLVSVDRVKRLLKVHNGVESDDHRVAPATSVITLQDDMMHTLQKHGIDSSFPVSPLTFHTLPVRDGTTHTLAVRSLRWVEGTPMSDLRDSSVETLCEAGRLLGTVCVALDPVPGGERYHAWDGRHTADLRSFTQYVTDPTKRAMVETVLDRFEREVLPDAARFRTGVLQADFNDANIIMREGRVSGVIDFGDAVRSWRVLDVTLSMAYAMLSVYGKTGHSLGAAAAVLRGFHSVYPLTALERRHVRLLMTCRLACSVTLGAFSLQQNPANSAYLLLHAQPAWDALTMLTCSDNLPLLESSIDNLFDLACDGDFTVAQDGKVSCADISMADPHVMDVLRSCRPIPPTIVSSPSLVENKPVITFVTGNKKKLEEVKRILSSSDVSGDLPFHITNHKIDLPELQGDPVEVATEKCKLAAEALGGQPVVTEDTSLCYNALHGLPGPYIKWFLDKCGHDGLNRMLDGYEDKSGYAQTVVACTTTGRAEDIVVFDGRTNGTIVRARGALDFGWDPIFEPKEQQQGGDKKKTYAEMSGEEKDGISHRSRAFLQLREYLLNL